MNGTTYRDTLLNLLEYTIAYRIAAADMDGGAGRTVAKDNALRAYACCVALAEHSGYSDPVAHWAWNSMASKWTATLAAIAAIRDAKAGAAQVHDVSGSAQHAADAAARLRSGSTPAQTTLAKAPAPRKRESK